MSVKQPPFTPTRLEEDREQGGDFVTIRLNEQDREKLDTYKQDNGIIKDSSAYKDALIIAQNVTHGRNLTPKSSVSFKKKVTMDKKTDEN